MDWKNVSEDKLMAMSKMKTSDWVNSRTIIFLGVIFLETTLTDSKFFMKAKEAGAKIITIDPTYTTTASKSHQWIGIKPGTDAALLLAMISTILENKWYQYDYLVQNTSAPFLVREDNQQLLKVNDAKEGGENNPYLVWDQNSQSVKPYNGAGVKAQLEGEFTVNGVKVKTVFTSLVENQKQYTVKWASEKTEIPEEVIYELTKDYVPAVRLFLAGDLAGVISG